jgi:hypothetical protein
MKNALKNFLFRLLFCLLFVALVFYVRSYNGELINNAQVQWQYLKSDEGIVYLALDVYSPSGIKINGIFSDDREVTDYWQLINYPDWYKGKENFEKIGEFRKILHPFLPYNKDFDSLYTTGWYTFLYEWGPKHSDSVPLESSIKIKYQNVGTQNYYYAHHVSEVRIVSNISESKVDGPVIDLQMFYPRSSSHKYSDENKPRVVLDNLVPRDGSLGYVLEDLGRDDYGISIRNEDSNVVDSLKGFVKWDSKKVYHVYFKTHEPEETLLKERGIDFKELSRHFAAVVFMVYFVLICRCVGQLFVRWWGIVLDGHSEKLFIPIFLGIIFLTYLFFGVGILKLLYFPVLFVVLVAVLFFGYESSKEAAFYIKEGLGNEFNKMRKSPWRIIFLALLGFMLFYNLSYCFVPATYIDGSGDIVNSYLPTLNSYVISHSFTVDIYNSTTGINSQAIDVLRAVVMVFAGESGVYLLSFAYLLLILGGIYLIGKKIFNINSMLIYLTALLFLSESLFTEAFHFGKLYPAALSFLLMSLYSSRFSNDKRNYILPALFFAFLTSQYVFFVVTALAYYLFIFSCFFHRYGTIKAPVFKLHTKSLIVFCALCAIFHLKLIIEVGICFPPGIIPKGIGDFFLNLNRDNDLYKYIDNNYIKQFYDYHMLAMDQYKVTLLKSIGLTLKSIRRIDFAYIFLFAPFLILNRYKKLYIFETVVIMWFIGFLFPRGNERVKVYYIFPLVILQFAIINDFISGFVTSRFFKKEKLDVTFTLGNLRGRLSAVPSIKEVLVRVFKARRIDPVISFRDFRLNLGQVIDRFFNLKVAFAIMLFLMLPYFIFKDFPKGFFKALPKEFKTREFKWVNSMYYPMDHRCQPCNQPWKWFHRQVLPVFMGAKSKYEYLQTGNAHLNFDHAMLIRQYSDIEDKILIVPVRFHSHAMRHITARHALGSVIYQKDVNQIMKDLKKLNINYLSVAPIHYKDYNPFYTPIFEEDIFFKYFKLLFSDNERKFYKIIHDGTNEDYSPSPFDVRELPFVPMTEAKKL